MSGFFCCYKPKSKVRDIYRETHKPSEDALHDARNKVEATIGIAEGTDIELRQQGTQIDRIDSTVDAEELINRADKKMYQAKEHIGSYIMR